jgi:hypothetical protein
MSNYTNFLDQLVNMERIYQVVDDAKQYLGYPAEMSGYLSEDLLKIMMGLLFTVLSCLAICYIWKNTVVEKSIADEYLDDSGTDDADDDLATTSEDDDSDSPAELSTGYFAK